MIAQLTITLNDDGTVSVTGPIDNQLACYGMLEMARDALSAHTQNKSRLVQPAAVLPIKSNGRD